MMREASAWGGVVNYMDLKNKKQKWNQTSGLVGHGGGGRGGRRKRRVLMCQSRGRAGVKRDGRAAGAETKRKPQNQN